MASNLSEAIKYANNWPRLGYCGDWKGLEGIVRVVYEYTQYTHNPFLSFPITIQWLSILSNKNTHRVPS
jgi:hypothetical protein